jgi:ribosome-associated toxin RatA of RatAB toxin-antitoxin module
VKNRFNGFSPGGKPIKRLAHRWRFNTRLKPGANEISALLDFALTNNYQNQN